MSARGTATANFKKINHNDQVHHQIGSGAGSSTCSSAAC